MWWTPSGTILPCGLWKNYDEAWWGGISVSNLLDGYVVIKQEDTNHPVVQTHAPRGTVSDLQPYNVAADVLALDIYPVTSSGSASNPPIINTQVSQVGDWAQVLSQVAGGQKEFWLIEQIAFSGTTPPTHTLVFPTFTQSRFMAYQAINNGARGLMFFGGNITSTLNAQDLPYGWNWTFWTNVLKPLVQQLGDKGVLANALVAPSSKLPISMSGTTAPDVEFCVREVATLPMFIILPASKREGATLNITFSGLPSWATNGEVLYESPRTILAQERSIHGFLCSIEMCMSIASPKLTFRRHSSCCRQARPTTLAQQSLSPSLPTAPGRFLYQWRKNNLNLSDGGNITGSTTPTLTLSSIASVRRPVVTLSLSPDSAVSRAAPPARS